MGILLAIDQGNTRVKYTIFDHEDRLLRSVVTPAPDLDAIVGLAGECDIDGAAYASVAGIDVRFVESLRRLCADRLLVVTHSTPVPVANHYATPGTLGADRLAAAVGAAALCPGRAVLVADCGSALTCDLLSPEPAYIGGTIAPGAAMRMRALHAYTSRLPEISWTGTEDLPPFPADTAGAIRSGAVRGLADQIRASHAAACRIHPGARLILTGGDAQALLDTRLLSDLDPLCLPHLVPYGLIRILRYNDNLA